MSILEILIAALIVILVPIVLIAIVFSFALVIGVIKAICNVFKSVTKDINI